MHNYEKAEKNVFLKLQMQQQNCVLQIYESKFMKEQIFSYEKEKEKLFAIILNYINKIKITTLFINENEVLLTIQNSYFFVIKNKEHRFDWLIEKIKEKYLNDRILGFIEKANNVSYFRLNSYPNLHTMYYEFLNQKHIYEFWYEEEKLASCEKNFLSIMLSYLLKQNEAPLALIEKFYWNNYGKATPLGNYILKKGNIQIDFDYYILPDILENVRSFMEYSGQKLYRVLNGGEL